MNHIVLHEPLIPQNTGNIMRTAIATNARLHLIKPLGFSLDDKYLRRSGLDYLDKLDYRIYDTYEAFMDKNPGQYFYMTRYGRKSPDAFNFKAIKEDIYLVFGKETTGIPKTILKSQLERCMRLPMSGHVRSLNLSNAVAITIYEVLRQQGYPDLFTEEPEHMKGADHLDKKD